MAGRNTKLDARLQKQIVKLLKTGVSIKDTCAALGIHHDTYYGWLERGAAGESPFSEFSEAVSRAHNAAKVTAIGTLRGAMSPTKTVKKVKNTFTETRVNVYGREYPYTRVEEEETTIIAPGDWRAAVEYLRRRFPDEWSDKQVIDMRLDVKQLTALLDALESAGMSAADVFNGLIAELDSARTGTPDNRAG